jgi:predicted HTH domain antitoxin
MRSLRLDIPEEILDEARIPPSERESTLLRELAVHLYARELLPKAAARRLSGMDRIAFDELLGQRGVTSRLSVEDLNADLRCLEDWRRASRPETTGPQGGT